MHFNKTWITLCVALLMSTLFAGSFAAAVPRERSHEVHFLTGPPLAEAIKNAKAHSAANLAIPTRRSIVLRQANPVCTNAYVCDLSYVNQAREVEAMTFQVYEHMVSLIHQNQKYALQMAQEIAAAESQNQDLPGDVGQSFYLAFAANGYALVSSLISTGAVQAYLQISNSGLYINSIISLENLNSILPYCGDVTYDALASRVASLVDGFLSQYLTASEGDGASPTVVSANVDSNTGSADGISVGGSFLLASGEQPMSQQCPAFGDTW